MQFIDFCGSEKHSKNRQTRIEIASKRIRKSSKTLRKGSRNRATVIVFIDFWCQKSPKSSNFAFRFSIWTEIPAKKWKNTQKVGPEIDRGRRKTIPVFAFTTAVSAPKSAHCSRWNIKNFTSRQSVGETKFWHFSCFQKRHFSRFALQSGPKMPPERDSWRLRNPSENRVRGPFWRPKKRFLVGV